MAPPNLTGTQFVLVKPRGVFKNTSDHQPVPLRE